MERYLTAAQKISRTAVGLPPSSPNIDYFRVADDRAQDDRLPAQLFGTRGGASIDYTFPMDAHYTIRVELSRDLNEQVPIYAEPQLLEVSIDGERVNVFTLPGVAAPPPPPPSEPVAASDVPADDPAAPSTEPAATGRAAACAAARRAEPGARAWRSWPGEPSGTGAAQPRRQGLGDPRSGEGRPASGAGRVREAVVGGGRNDARAVPAPVSGRRQHRGNTNGSVPAQRRDRRSVRSDRAGQLAEPSANLHVSSVADRKRVNSQIANSQLPRHCGDATEIAMRRMREIDSRHSRAPRLSSSGDVRRHRAVDGVLSRRRRDRQLRRRDRSGAAASAHQPGVPAARRSRSRRRPGEHAVSDQRRRARIAPVVLPVEQHSRR